MEESSRVASKRGKFWFPKNWFGTPLILKVDEQILPKKKILLKKGNLQFFSFFIMSLSRVLFIFKGIDWIDMSLTPHLLHRNECDTDLVGVRQLTSEKPNDGSSGASFDGRLAGRKKKTRSDREKVP